MNRLTEQLLFPNTIQWMKSAGYFQGVLWTLLCCLTSNINDMLMKSTVSEMNPFQIVFFRSFFGCLILIPYLLSRRHFDLKTKNPKIHIIRIIIGASAITLACFSTRLLSLPEVTVLSFAQPLFFLPMAFLLLSEKLTVSRILANIFGFLGVVIVLVPNNRSFLSLAALVPLTSAFLFTYLDIITKKITSIEKPLTLIFYFNIGTAIFTGGIALFNWTTPSLWNLFLLFLLGCSASLIQLFSYMSLASANILSLAPLRYIELLFSCIFGILIFNESPTFPLLLGSGVIIMSVLFVSQQERKSISDGSSLKACV